VLAFWRGRGHRWGRGAWVGWLTTEPATEAAVANTARVINDLAPDILGVVEAENRVVLKHFTDAQLREGAAVRYPHVMLIDGNDDRGIDVAILTKEGWPLGTVRSHVDDTDDVGAIFGRDCPEYEVRTPGGHRVVVLVNHLKSKGYGSQADNNERRRRQAQRVADIYRRLRKDGVSYVVVLGDTPSSAPFAPLIEVRFPC
jgi:endonuclease/exonuclease/phosphatase family metal-dependent hydrolase